MSESPPEIPPSEGPPQVPAVSQPEIYVPHQEDLTTGMLSHLVAILAGIIGSVVMYLCMNNKTPFVAHHTKEALNFQLTLFIVSMSMALVGGILTFLTLGIALFLLLPLLFAFAILALIWEIQACTAANRGEWHQYPWTIRFIQ